MKSKNGLAIAIGLMLGIVAIIVILTKDYSLFAYVLVTVALQILGLLFWKLQNRRTDLPSRQDSE